MLGRAQRALTILVAAAVVLPARAQERGLRLIEYAPPAATVAPPPTPWPTDFAAAVAAAKQRHVPLLLFFTAKW